MKTRTGKIAQLPKLIRDDLNQRLQNGKQGPELLRWLNSLPETQDLLAAKFDNQPINRQNLCEWRHGGYEDWLRHQDRELRIQRVAEEGSDLADREGDADLYENTSRIAIAELMADLDDLHQLKGEARWNRLRALTRELSRMQNAYNRSRWAELAWTKWHDRVLGPDDYEYEEQEIPDTKIQNSSPNTESPSPTPISDLRDANQTPEFKPIQTTSTEREVQNGTPACSRLSPDGRVALPRDPIIRHAPSRDENPTPPITSQRTTTTTELPKPHPHADFLRQMALLRANGQFP